MIDIPKYPQPARITVEFLKDDEVSTIVIECDHLDMSRHKFVQVIGTDDESFQQSIAGGRVTTLVAYTEPKPIIIEETPQSSDDIVFTQTEGSRRVARYGTEAR